jgi:hypothetical protein
LSSTIALVVMGILLIFVIAWVVLISYNLGLVRRSQRILTRGMTDNTLQEILAAHFVRVDGLEDRIAQTEQNIEVLHNIQLGAIQRIGLVRYDAFSDMGGELSFALALLNEHGDGVVISTITGRAENRTYTKQVRGGRAAIQPSAEETAAIQQAMGGR